MICTTRDVSAYMTLPFVPTPGVDCAELVSPGSNNPLAVGFGFLPISIISAIIFEKHYSSPKDYSWLSLSHASIHTNGKGVW